MGEISRKNIPMLRYAFLLATGICIGHYLSIPAWIGYCACIGAFLYIVYQIRAAGNNYRMHIFTGMVIMLPALGILRMQGWQDGEKQHGIKVLRITSFPQYQSYQIQFEATELDAGRWLDRETYLVQCKDTSLNLQYGDVFITNKQAELVEAPALPFEFDYKTFLSGNGITQQLRLCTINIQPDSGMASAFYHRIAESRTQFKKSTAVVFRSPATRGLAESLLLGYKENLDRETKDDFLKSGVSHLLAVSGMHTALIYEAIFLLFLPLGRSQKHRFIFLAIALFVLFYFTLLSGCSASVLRSSVMCSMFAIAYAFRKKGSGLNTLGTSIVLILWFCPYQLWNLGFQLSVFAVLGILTLHRFISGLFSITNNIFRYLFDAVSITVCAQVTTLPIILYHFHSFPVYFIPANLLLIPLSTIALFASMFSIFIAGIGNMPWLFSTTEWLVELFASCADLIAALPCSMIHPLAFSALEALLVAALIAYYIQYPFVLSRKIILTCTLLCLCWSGFRVYAEIQEEQKSSMFFISNSKRSALVAMSGLEAAVLNQKPLPAFDEARLKMHYNINSLSSAQLPENSSGILMHADQATYAWICKKNCTAINDSIAMVFSYKKADSIYLKAKKHQLLQVKNITAIK
ncbi:MAG: ComEC/Rec2 family competence protein [Cytophaga sp.]|uniref:ComEC/Rec2 family competence protein n=1 Tax=Cytophaga sp. TaxID=29535 RepID=UPI003F803970